MKLQNLWYYYRNEVIDEQMKIMKLVFIGQITIKQTICESFECKTKITGNTPAGKNKLDTEFVVPLEDLSNFWGSLTSDQL